MIDNGWKQICMVYDHRKSHMTFCNQGETNGTKRIARPTAGIKAQWQSVPTRLLWWQAIGVVTTR